MTTAALAAIVALAVKRPVPRFAVPPIATVRDTAGHPLWSIRLAARAHEISADRLAVPPETGNAYQLWLATTAGPRSLGVLPRRGRAVIPEIPAIVARLAGSGELLVSREPRGGASLPQPSGPIVYRAGFRPG